VSITKALRHWMIAAETTRAARPLWPIVRGVDTEFAALDLLAVEALDGLRGFGLARKLDKGETPRTTGFAVGPDVYVGHLSGGAECLGKLLLSGAETQVANEDACGNGKLLSMRTGRAFSPLPQASIKSVSLPCTTHQGHLRVF